MPHSLRAKIKSLRYKGIITDKDCDRLCKALDNENVLDKIRAEIEQLRNFRAENYDLEQYCDCFDVRIIFRDDVFEIIDKYKEESEK